MKFKGNYGYIYAYKWYFWYIFTLMNGIRHSYFDDSDNTGIYIPYKSTNIPSPVW